MSEPWWEQLHGVAPAPGDSRSFPRLTSEDAAEIADGLLARRSGFTPEWTPAEGLDAGAALVKLFSEQTALVAQRLNRLPEKAAIEFFRATGIEPQGARPAEALVEFTIAPAAPTSILAPAGLQLGAAAADGSGQVIFETQANVYVTSSKIGALQAQSGASVYTLPLPDGTDASGILPFGPEGLVGAGLRIGLDGPVRPTDGLTVYFKVASAEETPRPHSAGGFAQTEVDAPGAQSPVLLWEILSENGAEPLEVLRDDTRSLTVSGVLEFRLPTRWDPFVSAGVNKSMRWLRVRLVNGRYPTFRVTDVRLNLALARAVRTIRDEIVEPIASSDPPRMKLSQKSILPDSLVLEIDVGTGAAPKRWAEVDDLSVYGPEDRVFVLDAAKGELVFGTGIHGRAVPEGFRNVRAVKYQIASGKASKVAQE